MKTAIRLVAQFLVLASPGAANAAPANSATIAGTARAEVVAPSRVQLIENLRFGAMIRPLAAGSLIIAPDGTETPAGGVVGNTAMPQPADGRGPATFRIAGEGARHFLVKLPNRVDITNGTATMRVDKFKTNTTNGNGVLGPPGTFELHVGGTLNVGANQQTGSYSGTFDVTVTYL
ncbi:MAG: DUF4402 domain-containing protein [Novosphingobium sp.]